MKKFCVVATAEYYTYVEAETEEKALEASKAMTAGRRRPLKLSLGSMTSAKQDWTEIELPDELAETKAKLAVAEARILELEKMLKI